MLLSSPPETAFKPSKIETPSTLYTKSYLSLHDLSRKVSLAKLANFLKMECFMLVACLEHTLLLNDTISSRHQQQNREYRLAIVLFALTEGIYFMKIYAH
jgi:hypothetical protein